MAGQARQPRLSSSHSARGESAEGTRVAAGPPLGGRRDSGRGTRDPLRLLLLGVPRRLARGEAAAPRGRPPRRLHLDGDPRRLLPPVRGRVAADARGLGARDSVPSGAPGRDGVDPRQVRAGDGLDPGRTDCGAAAVRGPRHAARAGLDAARGRALRARRGARLLRQPDLGRLQRGSGAAAPAAGGDRGGRAAPADLHAGDPSTVCDRSAARTCRLSPTRRWSACSATTA